MLQARGRSGSPLPSLVAVQPKGPRPPFFCVHSIFGIVNYRQLALALIDTYAMPYDPACPVLCMDRRLGAVVGRNAPADSRHGQFKGVGSL